jgi:hypothetical protein
MIERNAFEQSIGRNSSIVSITTHADATKRVEDALRRKPTAPRETELREIMARRKLAGNGPHDHAPPDLSLRGTVSAAAVPKM